MGTKAFDLQTNVPLRVICSMFKLYRHENGRSWDCYVLHQPSRKLKQLLTQVRYTTKRDFFNRLFLTFRWRKLAIVLKPLKCFGTQTLNTVISTWPHYWHFGAVLWQEIGYSFVWDPFEIPPSVRLYAHLCLFDDFLFFVFFPSEFSFSVFFKDGCLSPCEFYNPFSTVQIPRTVLLTE